MSYGRVRAVAQDLISASHADRRAFYGHRLVPFLFEPHDLAGMANRRIKSVTVHHGYELMAVSYNSVEIDLSAIRENYINIWKRVGDQVRVMAVVKADAYGHGAVRIVRVLHSAGCRIFGVTEVEEGVILRQAGVSGDIVIMLGVSEYAFDEVVRHGLTPVVFDLTMVKALSDYAERMNVKVGVQLKVDVGMGRLGIMPHEVRPFISAMESMNGVFLIGLLGHFPMADGPDHDKTLGMFREFESIVSQIPDSVRNDQIMHMANSAAMIRYSEAHLDMVRTGISLYGCYPSDSEHDRTSLSLKPAMSFKTRVIQVKEVPEGYGLSYGHIYVTDRPSRLAVLPVGYDDGYLRRLSNRGEVLIRGRRAPIRGRVCMNLCMADVTDLPGVTVGDEVVLMGRQESSAYSYSDEITADEVAGRLDTNNYEVLCLFGNSNRRVYVNYDKSAS